MYAPNDQEVTSKVEEILTMLTYKRPGGSESEEAWLDRFVRPLKNHPNATQYVEDSFGNIFIEVAGGSELMMTAHSDTVHATPGTQEVLYDNNIMVAYKGNDNQPLGADDAAGVWVLMEMVRAGVPCWVCIFRMEEKGGLGSSFAAKDNPEFFKTFKWCVSIDRRGTSDIITHQSWGRCCSDALADHLSRALNAHGLDYAPCDGGIFTDSANFTDIIPECLNVASGYNNEHRNEEELDVDHLLRLRDALVKIDWTTMPVKREPGEDDFKYDYSWLNYRNFNGFNRDVVPFDRPKTPSWSKTTARKPAITADDLYDMDHTDLVDAMIEDPEAMADAIWDLLWGGAQPIDFDPEDGIN